MTFFTIHEKNMIEKNHLNDKIYTVVQDAFTTDNGYSGELSKHMSEGVFQDINVFNRYSINNPQNKNSYRVNFSLKKDSQILITGLFIVKMTYSIELKDLQSKSVSGSWNIPATFTIIILGDKFYIFDESEPA